MLDLREVGVGNASHCRNLAHRQLGQLSLPSDDLANQIFRFARIHGYILETFGVMRLALALLA